MTNDRPAEPFSFYPTAGAEIPSCPGWRLVQSLHAEEGNGSTAVWLAHRGDEKRVFKFCRPTGEGDTRQMLEVLRKEVTIRDCLRGRVTRFVDYVDKNLEDPAAPYVAFEYHPAGSLSQALRENGGGVEGLRDEQTRLGIVASVAEMIQQLNNLGCSHGDPSAANVILVKEGENTNRLVPYLTDMGRAEFWTSPGERSDAAPAIPSPGPGANSPAEPANSPPESSHLPDDRTHEVFGPPGGTAERTRDEATQRRADLRGLALLLYQVTTRKLDPSQFDERWPSDVKKDDIIRRIIEDYTRRDAECHGTPADFARRVRDVPLARANRRFRRVVAFALLLIAVVAALSVSLVTTWIAWVAVEEKNQAQQMELKAGRKKVEAQQKQLEAEQGKLRAEEEARANAEKALDEELANALAVGQSGLYADARQRCRALLRRPGLSPEKRRQALLCIIRASAALGDVEAVKEGLGQLGEDARLPAALFEKAMYLLDREMRQSAASPDGLAGEPGEDQKEAVRLLEEVRDARELPEEDRLTARAILDENPDKALDFLRQALARVPGHFYANCYLVSTALLAGRPGEALAAAQRWGVLSPRDPAPVLYEAVLLTVLGRHEEADRALKGLADPKAPRPVGQDVLASYRAAVKLIRAVNAGFSEMPLDEAIMIRFIRVAGEIYKQYQEDIRGLPPADGSYRVPLTPAQRQCVGRFSKAFLTGMFGDPRLALKQMNGVGRFMPAGLQSYLRAQFHARLNDRAGIAENLTRAADAPAIFMIRRFCLLNVANYKLQAAAKSQDPEKLRREARLLLRQAREGPPMNRVSWDKYINLVRQSGDTTFADDLRQEHKSEKAP